MGFNVLRKDYGYYPEKGNFIVRFHGASFNGEIDCYCEMTERKINKLLEAYDYLAKYGTVSFTPNLFHIPAAISRSELEKALRRKMRSKPDSKTWKWIGKELTDEYGAGYGKTKTKDILQKFGFI